MGIYESGIYYNICRPHTTRFRNENQLSYHFTYGQINLKLLIPLFYILREIIGKKKIIYPKCPIFCL